MQINIFYSWQSDTNEEYNKNFIGEALDIAKKKLSRSFTFNRINIDRDTKGVSGTPSIVNSIDKKIKGCQVFVADLTITNSPPTLIKGLIWLRAVDKIKLQPNGNVLDERGRASSIVGNEKIICIANEAYETIKEENVLFDLRQNRFPITYNYSKKNKNEKKKILEKLSDDITFSIRQVLNAGITNPIYPYSPFLEWSSWQKHINNGKTVNFVKSKTLEGKLSAIRDLSRKEKSIVRIVGLSGLGKTRLVYEAFNPDCLKKGKNLFENILYADINSFGTDSLITTLQRLSENHERKIIIIDNCDHSTHHELVKYIQSSDSRLSLITIHYEPIKSSIERSSDTNFIEVNNEDYDEIVDKILMEYFPEDKDRADREKIKHFAKGHTQIAVSLVLNKRKKPDAWLPIVDSRDLIAKLIGDNNQDSDVKNVLQAIAIFNKVGHFEGIKGQSEFISSCQLISKLNYNSDLSIQKFREIVELFLKKGIIEKQGRYIRIRILPIAISLAMEWWSSCDEELTITLFKNLEEQPELLTALSEQLTYLDIHEDAKQIVKKLCEPSGPFGNAEVLNTEMGSRLFRSFVEVNPLVVVECLYRNIICKSKKDIELIKLGRRNLVWALEKLCFRKDTFEKAAKILLAFSVSENEHRITNNATGQLRQLFHIHLAGTETNLSSRMSIIDYALSKNDSQYLHVGVNLLFSTLSTDYFTRMQGAENQGVSQKLQDYYPTRDEIMLYWETAIDKLVDISQNHSEFKDVIFKTIIDSIRGLARRGASSLSIKIINIISKDHQKYWLKLQNTIALTLKYEDLKLQEDDKKIFLDYKSKLLVTDLKVLYTGYIKKSNYHERNEKDDFISFTRRKAREIAKKMIVEERISEEFLNLFFVGEQQFGGIFGEEIGSLIVNKKEEFIDSFFELSQNINKDYLNLNVISGFLNSYKDDLEKFDVFKRIASIDKFKKFTPYIVHQVRGDIKYFNILIDLVELNEIKISELTIFKYGGSLDYLSVEELNRFFKKLVIKFNIEGARISISLLYNYCWNDQIKFNQIKALLKEILLVKGILPTTYETMFDKHSWAELVIKVIESNVENEFIINITNDIVNLCRNFRVISIDHDYINVLSFIFDHNFKLAWSVIAPALLDNESEDSAFWSLTDLLGSHLGGMGNEVGLLFKYDLNIILNWARENKPNSGISLGRMTPIFNEDKSDWHSFTKKLIDEFGDNKDFINALSINMGTYSWCGSIVPLLEAKRTIVNKLLDHKHDKIREWAAKNEKDLLDYIHQENNFDVERYL